MDPIRLLIVDDDSAIRRALRRILTSCEFAEADSCEAALDWLASHAPFIDLVLLDLRFPGGAMQGDAALAEIRRRWPHLGVVVMTGVAYDVPTAIRCTQLGALAFVTKLGDFPMGLGALVERACRVAVMRRQVDAYAVAVLDPRPADGILPPARGGVNVDENACDAHASSADDAPLTARETQVLGLLGDGFSRTAIAGQLGIRECTVDTFLGRVRCKTGLWTTADLTKLAIRRGLTKLGR